MIHTFSEAEKTAAVMKELCSGRRLLDEMQHYREVDAAREAAAQRGSKSAGALGKAVLAIPQREWFQMREKYGDECWSDRGFVKDVGRLEPQFKIHNV